MDNYIAHYGIKRRSGRYPWGSGEKPYQSDPNQAKRYYAESKAAKKNGTETDTERRERTGKSLARAAGIASGVTGGALTGALLPTSIGHEFVTAGISSALAFGLPAQTIAMIGFQALVGSIWFGAFGSKLTSLLSGTRYLEGENWSNYNIEVNGETRSLADLRKEYKEKYGFTDEIK